MVVGSPRCSNMISWSVISTASFGLKPRTTRFRARCATLSRSELSRSDGFARWANFVQSCSAKLAAAKRSYALFASASVRRVGAEKVHPHCEQAQPWGCWCATQISHLPKLPSSLPLFPSAQASGKDATSNQVERLRLTASRHASLDSDCWSVNCTTMALGQGWKFCYQFLPPGLAHDLIPQSVG